MMWGDKAIPIQHKTLGQAKQQQKILKNTRGQTRYSKSCPTLDESNIEYQTAIVLRTCFRPSACNALADTYLQRTHMPNERNLSPYVGRCQLHRFKSYAFRGILSAILTGLLSFASKYRHRNARAQKNTRWVHTSKAV